MTPIFNKIGTIARARIYTKRHVRFEIGLQRVIAGAQAYNMWYTSLGTDKGYWGGKGEFVEFLRFFRSLPFHSHVYLRVLNKSASNIRTTTDPLRGRAE